MKKVITISAVIITMIGILISATPWLLSLTGLDKPVKNYIVRNIFKNNRNHLDLKQIHIGLGRLEVDQLSFSNDNNRLEILIDKVNFEFNFLKLLTSLSKPQNALDEIVIYKPRLIYHYTQNAENSIPGKSVSIPDIAHLISDIPEIESLRIHDGKIIYEEKSGSYIAVSQNLNGWLSAADTQNVEINVHGNIFSTENDNFKLDVHLNDADKKFTARVDVLDYTFENSILPHFTRQILLDTGNAKGFLNIEGSLTDPTKSQMNGSIIFSNIDLSIEDQYFNSLNFTVNIDNNRLKGENGRFEYLNNPFIFTAICDDIFHPKFKGTLKTADFPIKNLSTYFPVGFLNSSNFNLQLSYKTDLNEFSLKGLVHSNHLSLYHENFESALAEIQVNGKGIEATKIHLNNNQWDLAAKGYYNFDKSMLNLVLKSQYQTGNHAFFDKISDGLHSLNTSLVINTKTGYKKGNWVYNISKYDTLFSLKGIISGLGDNLSISSDHSSEKDFNLSLNISNYLGKPVINYANVHNFPFHVLTSDKLVKSFGDNINTSASLSGTFDHLEGDIFVDRKAKNDSLVVLKAAIDDILSEHKRIHGKLTIANIHGDYDIDFNKDFLGANFSTAQGLDGNLYIDLTKSEQLSGQFDLKNFKLFSAISHLNDPTDFRKQATLDGEVVLSGDLKNPSIKVKVSGDKFVFNDVGYFQSKAVLQIDKTGLRADSLVISKNNSPILNSNFTWSFLNKQINGKINGQNLDIVPIQKAIWGDNVLLTGLANYNLRISGPVKSPVTTGSVNITNGQFGEIDFDNIQLSLSDQVVPGGDFLNYKDHKILVENFFMTQAGRYHLRSAGTFPLAPTEDLDFFVNFDGDALGMIKYWEPFFTDGASLTDIALKFKGTSDDIRLVAADIKIDRGELWLKSVAKHIENISGHITLKEGTGKVNIHNLKAHINDDYLEINTVRNVTVSSGEHLENWDFKGLGLDFGILQMETSGKGVTLHIPGLMENEDTGQLKLTGKNDNESFYFAGPIKHPVAYGKMTLNNARLTYPFIVNHNPNSKPSPVVLFLANVQWNVFLKPGEDVVYVRDIPAYIDNVHAEITVDDASDGVAFTGIINKDTFKPLGSLLSTRGWLEYLDQSFKVDRFTLEFNRYNTYPDVSGRAWTTIRDSVGAIPKTIYLQLYALDPETGQERQSGNWEDFKFKLVSADPSVGETQEQVLAYLGYSVNNIREKASNVGGALTERYLIRPLLRPIERVLEKSLGMDLVRFNSGIGKNLFVNSFNRQNINKGLYDLSGNLPYLYLMSSSEITLGKYLNQNLYLSYTGQLVSVYDKSQSSLDFNHSIGLEYRFYRNILLEFEYDRELMGYYNYLNQRQYLEDFKIRLRHSFSF